jgi:hypothetical protein
MKDFHLVELALGLVAPCVVTMTHTESNAAFKLGIAVVCVLTTTERANVLAISIAINGANHVTGLVTLIPTQSTDMRAATIAGVILRNCYAFMPIAFRKTIDLVQGTSGLDGKLPWHPARIAAFALAVNRQSATCSPTRFFCIADSSTATTWMNGDAACTIVFTYGPRALQVAIAVVAVPTVVADVPYAIGLAYERDTEAWKTPPTSNAQILKLLRDVYFILITKLVV